MLYELTCCSFETSADGQRHLPDVRTSILRTLSKIFGSGLSACFPMLRSFLRSEAAHFSAVFAAVNTSLRVTLKRLQRPARRRFR